MAQQSDVVFDPPIDRGVVVGFDGSTAALRAVTVAADEALLRRVPLHVVRAWMLSSAAAEARAPHGDVPSLDEVERAVDDSLDRARAEAETGRPDLEVVLHCHHGKTVPALVEASRLAELLVVSRRGQGGFVDLLMGSTADQVVRHAKSAVLVVRPPAT